MTFYFDTFLSLFLGTVNERFCDIWTYACYLHADNLFQLGDSLGIVLMYSVLWVTIEIKVEVKKIQ